MKMSNLFVLNTALIYTLLSVFGLIALDLILGIAVALQAKTFSLQVLPQFLETEVLPYGLSLSALVGAAQLNMSALAAGANLSSAFLVDFAWAALGAYILRIVSEIAAKLFTLFGITVTETPASAKPVKQELPPAGISKGDSVYQSDKVVP